MREVWRPAMTRATKRRRRDRGSIAGFTLIETLIATALMMTIFGALATVSLLLASGITLAAAIEELLAVGFVDRGGGQLGGQTQLVGRWWWQDNGTSQPDQQVQRSGMKI